MREASTGVAWAGTSRRETDLGDLRERAARLRE
jgi:hypothetical protein